jgi:hypothetical protein
MAASLGANSLVFAMGAVADPAIGISQTIKRAPLEIEGFRMVYTVVASVATPAPFSLQLFKSSNNAQAMPTGGTALTALPKRTLDAGGDSGMIADTARIATTVTLTAGTFTRGSVPLATFDITQSTPAGARFTFDYMRKWDGSSLWLDPGEILVVSNPAAFPLLLQWTLTVNVDYRRRDTL